MSTTTSPLKMGKKIKKGAGGKLQRSEVVQTRMSPRLRFLAEIMARHQRRSLSSLIENLIENAADNYVIPVAVTKAPKVEEELFVERKYQKMPLQTAAIQLWSLEPSKRFAAMAFFLPDLLTPEEERLWHAIKRTAYFWNHFEVKLVSKKGKPMGTELHCIFDFRGIAHERLREHWPSLNAILEDQASIQEVFEPIQAMELYVPVEKPDYYPYPLEQIVITDRSDNDEY